MNNSYGEHYNDNNETRVVLKVLASTKIAVKAK